MLAAITLALGASFVYGLSDFLGGLKSRSLPQLSVLLISQGGALVVLVAVAAASGAGPPDGRYVLYAVLAGLAEAVGIAALYRGLAVGVMSVVAPIAATAAVIPVVVGAARGETPTALQNGGIALALVGVFLASRTEPASHTGRRLAEGAGLGILAAVFIGLFLTVFDRAAEPDPYWATLIGRTGSAVLIAVAALASRTSLRLPPPTLAFVAAVGLLDVVGNTLFAVASTKGLVGVVAVLSSLYPVVTVALARAFHRERLRRVQALGVAAAFAGVGLIAAG